MTDFYSDIAQIAHDILVAYGATCQLGIQSNGAYNTATGKASVAYTNQNITAAVFDFPQKFIDGTLIKTGDQRVIASVIGLTADPKPGCRFTDAQGKTSEVINAKQISPAGTKVLWILQVRK